MVIWFAAGAFLIVVLVFNSPAIDYRLIIVGAVLPVLEALIGGPWILHTLLGCVVTFVAVILLTRGRRLAGRRAVALPIGMFLHLVLDGTWARPKLFWWPFLGGHPLGHGDVPEFDHLGVSITLELIGWLIAIFLVRRFELDRPERRRVFLRSGRIARELLN